MTMANYIQTVSKHSVVPSQAGPDNFANVRGFSWTDQQGLGVDQGKTFRIWAGKTVRFCLPITNPVIFRDVRLRANLAAITLDLQNQDAFLSEFAVFDRTTEIFRKNGLNVTGDHSKTWTAANTLFCRIDTWMVIW
jgi:hypothetical protein